MTTVTPGTCDHPAIQHKPIVAGGNNRHKTHCLNKIDRDAHLIQKSDAAHGGPDRSSSRRGYETLTLAPLRAGARNRAGCAANHPYPPFRLRETPGRRFEVLRKCCIENPSMGRRCFRVAGLSHQRHSGSCHGLFRFFRRHGLCRSTPAILEDRRSSRDGDISCECGRRFVRNDVLPDRQAGGPGHCGSRPDNARPGDSP